jgi:hypothetical protein
MPGKANMTETRALLLLLLILTVCFGVAPLPALCFDFFPDWVSALVLIGYFGLVFLASVLAAKRISGGRRAVIGHTSGHREGGG